MSAGGKKIKPKEIISDFQISDFFPPPTFGVIQQPKISSVEKRERSDNSQAL